MKKSSGVPPSMTTTQVPSTSTPNSDIEKEWTLVEKKKKSRKVCTKVSCAPKCAQEVRDHLYQNSNKPTYQKPRVAPTDEEIFSTVEKHLMQSCRWANFMNCGWACEGKRVVSAQLRWATPMQEPKQSFPWKALDI